MDVAVTGSSGLIGTALLTALERAGHRAVRVVRRAAVGNDELTWDPAAGTIDRAGLEGIDAVVHLAGPGIGEHRWTERYKRALVDDRVHGTRLIASTLAELQRPPQVLLSGSAIGWYGARGDEELTETSAPGSGFLPDLCQQWEAATATSEAAGIRTAHLRTGIVLSAAGGALGKQLPLFKLGLGGRMGSGRQWMSWISIDDEVGAIVHLLGADGVRGAVNLTAPQPVTNAEFTRTLAAAVHRPAIVPIPSFGPKLLLGAELAENLLFTGARVVPAALAASGFAFRHAQLADALAAALDRGRAA